MHDSAEGERARTGRRTPRREVIIGFGAGEQSVDALALGFAIAEAEDASLAVASVFGLDPLLLRAGELPAARRGFFENRFDAVRAHCERLGCEFDEVPVTAISAQEGLHRAARVRGANTIVIGSNHRGPIGRTLLGGVGESLLASSPCSVAVAPRGLARHDVSLRRIGVAWDGSVEAGIALRRAARLASNLDATLHPLTVGPPHVDLTGETPMTPELLDRYASILDRAEEELPKTVRREPELLQGPVGSELIDRGADLDLLVVGSRSYGPIRRTLIGSTSRRLLRAAPCPVLVVPRSRFSVEPLDRGHSLEPAAESAPA